MKKHLNPESILAMYVFELMLKLDIPLRCNFTLLKVQMYNFVLRQPFADSLVRFQEISCAG